METISGVLHVVNIILILALLALYGQNYQKLKSKYTIGLILFSVLLLLHSAMGLLFDVTMVMHSDPAAATATQVVEAIKAVGFAVLLWISWE